MINTFKRKQLLIVIASLVLLFVLLTFGNLLVINSFPVGQDFVAHLQGIRSFLNNGISPYSAQTEADINNSLTNLNLAAEGVNYKFLSPMFSIIFYFPLTLVENINFSRAMWITILEIVLFGMTISLIRIGNWKKPWFLSALLILYALLSVSSVLTLLSGNLVIISLALIVFSLSALRAGNDEAAGLMLAFSLVKPDAVFLVVIFLLIWAFIHKRSKIIYWFFAVFALLVGFSILLIPSWPLEYARSINTFAMNNPILTTNSNLTTQATGIVNRFSILKVIIIALILVFEWCFVKSTGYKRLFWLGGITLSLGIWVNSQIPGEFLVLSLPGFFFGLRLVPERWKENVNYLISGLIVVLFVTQWAISGVFSSKYPVTLNTEILEIALPAISLLLLYWSRWWVLLGKKISEIDNYLRI